MIRLCTNLYLFCSLIATLVGTVEMTSIPQRQDSDRSLATASVGESPQQQGQQPAPSGENGPAAQCSGEQRQRPRTAGESRRFIEDQLEMVGPMPEAYIDKTFCAEDLDDAGEMLLDPAYRRHWSTLASIVCCVGKRADKGFATDTIRTFVERRETDRVGGDVYLPHVLIVTSAGKIGSLEASALLRQAITSDGARELARDWIALLGRDAPSMMGYMRGSAAIGLVFSGDPENIGIVESAYSGLRTGGHGPRVAGAEPTATEEEDIIFYGLLAEALAIRDALVSHGREIYEGTLDEHLNIKSHYLLRYID